MLRIFATYIDKLFFPVSCCHAIPILPPLLLDDNFDCRIINNNFGSINFSGEYVEYNIYCTFTNYLFIGEVCKKFFYHSRKIKKI